MPGLTTGVSVDRVTENRTRVSIVTPFLNAERFLAESVESVLAQTRDDWELLLVDDGSTDHSRAIACADLAMCC